MLLFWLFFHVTARPWIWSFQYQSFFDSFLRLCQLVNVSWCHDVSLVAGRLRQVVGHVTRRRGGMLAQISVRPIANALMPMHSGTAHLQIFKYKQMHDILYTFFCHTIWVNWLKKRYSLTYEDWLRAKSQASCPRQKFDGFAQCGTAVFGKSWPTRNELNCKHDAWHVMHINT